MVFLKIFIYFVVVLILIEVLLQVLVDKVRNRFQWLITRKRDDLPLMDSKGLSKFLADGFDGELGWVRKPNTEHSEAGRFGQTVWHTNDDGARLNPGYTDAPSLVSCYGDSFTFCRQVNDDETWEHFLSGLTQTNVVNWGVGNHGIDQSLLRLKREYPKHPTGVVIIGIVPDTISRILSVWKHYYEYGNTFGFKPRFVLRDGRISLLKNPIDVPQKFNRIKDVVEDLKQGDFFYKNKFQKEIIGFPYLYSVLQNPSRNIPLIYWNLMAGVKGNSKKYTAMAMQKIMEINLDWRIRLYQDDEARRLLVGIISEISDYLSGNNCKMLIAFLPQKDDLGFIKKHGHFYQSFIDELSAKTLVVDLAADFLKHDSIDQLYSDDSNYGGHYSKTGNQLVARSLFNALKTNKFIN